MKKKLIAIATAAVAILPFAVSPAHATATAAFAFECTAKLNAFPSPSGTGKCEGSATVGSAGVGAVVGVSNGGQAYALVTTGVPNNFTATFNYSEPCIANEPPVAGTAAGTATISGLTGTKNGVAVSATATLNFQWTRVGVTAAIVINGGSISFSDGDSATGTIGAATAAFAPILQANNTCPSGGALEAIVAGAGTIGA